MSQLLEELLEAHVQHELSRCRGSALPERVAMVVDELFRWFETVRLDDVSSVAHVMSVIDRYVIDMQLSGGMTELAGELSQNVFASPLSAHTLLRDVVEDGDYERFAAKVTGLETLRRELITLITHSEAFAHARAQLSARMITELVLGAPSRHKLVQRLRKPLERAIEKAIEQHQERHRRRLVRSSEDNMLAILAPENMRSLADEIWMSISSLPLSEAFSLISENDLEDFVALGCEFWQRYRKTPYFRRISEEAVTHFFRKYGPQSLAFLLEELGIDERMVTPELGALLGPLLDQAVTTGLLERQIRRRLEPFYRSPAALAIATSARAEPPES